MLERKMVQNKNQDEEKIKELKIEYLKQPTKRQKIKRKIAKILTLQNKESSKSDIKSDNMAENK